MSDGGSSEGRRLRIGVVTYLNARPLTWCLSHTAAGMELVFDLPSRLADGLAAAQFEVALIPTIEYFRLPGAAVVSDACISTEGPVKSVKLYGRVPAGQVRGAHLEGDGVAAGDGDGVCANASSGILDAATPAIPSAGSAFTKVRRSTSVLFVLLAFFFFIKFLSQT